MAGECYDVGGVCDGADSVLWAWLISSDDQQTSSEVFSYGGNQLYNTNTYIKIYIAPKS